MNVPPNLPIVVVGAGGHGQVVATLAKRAGYAVSGFLDVSPEGRLDGLPLLGDDDHLEALVEQRIGIAMGLGSRAAWNRRLALCHRIDRLGSRAPTLIDPDAGVAHSVTISHGSQVLMGARIQSGVSIEDWCIVNTSAVIEHDCYIRSSVHIAPGAVLCGGVTVGEGTLIGAGSTVMEGVSIGSHATVGLGAAVIRDVADGQTVLGVPAKGIPAT